jgi:hypothetical protein
MPNFSYTSAQNENEILSYLPRLVSKVITDASVLTTGASPYTLFTVDGDVICRVFATVQTLMVSTSNNGTLAVGVTGNTAVLLPATTVDGTNLVAGAAWTGDNSPTLKAEALSSASLNRALIAGGADILATIATNSITAGAITFYCEYVPLNAASRVIPT